jgi:uncharacterized protein YaaN involved in tellurite resistance
MVTAIIILSLIVLVLGFTTYNLLKKNERCEDMITSYENYMKNLSGTIDFTNKKLKEIDAKGSFESDDEVGFFFKEVKILQEMLNDFNIK